MNREIIDRVEVLDSGELFLGIKGPGKPRYQYVYREAAGVYWDENKKGFKSTPLKEWSCSRWFNHIVRTVLVAVGVGLRLGSAVSWINIPEEQKEEIQHKDSI